MPRTPNHGYNVPTEGEQDWHRPLNENFEQYDTDIEIRDVDGNRGDYQPKAGAKFFATDTGNVYVGDGSGWNRVASSGEDPSFRDRSVARLGAKVERSSFQSLPEDTNERVAFDTTVWDDAGEFDTSNGEFVAGRTGRYHAITQLSFDLRASDADSRFVKAELKRNGASTGARTQLAAGAPGQFPHLQCSAHLELSAGDAVAVETRHRSDGPADVAGWLSVVRLG